MWLLALSLARAFITIPNVVKDLLMFPASFKRSPEAAVIFCLSDPARSTKWSFGVFRFWTPFTKLVIEKDIVKMEWDLDD